MTNLNKTLDALDAALKAATPGPLVQWENHASVHAGPVKKNVSGELCGSRGLVADHQSDDFGDTDAEGEDIANANAALHVAAVNALPWLLRIVKAAAARVEAERLYAFAVATEAVDLDALCEAKDAAESALIAALDAAEAEVKS